VAKIESVGIPIFANFVNNFGRTGGLRGILRERTPWGAVTGASGILYFIIHTLLYFIIHTYIVYLR